MELFKVENFSFTYKGCEKPVLKNISFNVCSGDFLLVCGGTGCGKTTLLRSLKKEISPVGKYTGSVKYKGKDVSESGETAQIAFVFQNPDTQIVCDTVRDEMCFTAENYGMASELIRRRMAELCMSFKIEHLIGRKTDELSGGEKQILSLMGAIMLHPQVIILDEPMSQLDPVCAEEFLKAVEKLNRDFGISVIMSEHNCDSVFSLANKVLCLSNGEVSEFSERKEFVRFYCGEYLPQSVRFCEKFSYAPVFSIRECRSVYEKNIDRVTVTPSVVSQCFGETLIKAKNISFKYSRRSPEVLSGINLEVKAGTALALAGGNGSGKSTLLTLLAGVRKCMGGSLRIKKGTKVAYLNQNPMYSFLSDTVYGDIALVLKVNELSENVLEQTLEKYAFFKDIKNLYEQNPLDLSAGQMQKLALLKVVLTGADVILLDEAEKGLDMSSRQELSKIFTALKEQGKGIVFVSHNPEFIYENADECAMLFAADVTEQERTRDFFLKNEIYTTFTGKVTMGIGDTAFTLGEVCVTGE